MMTLLITLGLLAGGASAADTLTLEATYIAAEAHFPLMGRVRLAERLAEIEAAQVSARFRPGISLDGQAVYHSSVPELPFSVPGQSPPDIPRDQYKAAVNVTQLVYDGGVGAVQQQLATTIPDLAAGEVEAALHDVMEHIDDLFFGVLLQDAAIETLRTLREELSERRRALSARVDAGLADGGAVDLVDVELLTVDQQITEARERRRGALDGLEVLMGRELEDPVVLRVPMATVDLHDRSPERAQLDLFRAQQRRLSLQRELAARKRRPTVSTFLTSAYGRPPGLDLFESDLEPYLSAGLRVSWSVWDWNSAAREQTIASIQSEVIDAEAAAFAQSIEAAAAQVRADVDRLDAMIEHDEAILDRRRRLAERSADRLEAGLISAADYVANQQAARRAALTLERHRIEQQYARVKYATIMGWNR